MRRFLFTLAFLLFATTPALADRASECRRQCGDDTACYRRCMGYSYHHYRRPGSSYWGPSTGAGEPRAYRRGPSVQAPSPAGPSEPVGGGGPAEKPSILGTAYDFLFGPGAETEGYGLYSYVILPRPGERAIAFVRELVGRFPAASDVTESKQRINILYLPTKTGAGRQAAFPADVDAAAIKAFLDKNYDFAMAQGLLFHLCDRPAPAVAQLCANDLSGGPYLLTYATKVSDLSPLPPPFLFVDLTNVRPRAFPLFVAEYAAQVKRPDFSDGERLSDFRLQLLNVMLTAADWVQPVSAAVADIAHFAEAKKNGGEAPK